MKTLLVGLTAFALSIFITWWVLIKITYIECKQISDNVYYVKYKQCGVEQRITAPLSVLSDYGFNEKAIIKKSKEI